MKNYPTKVLQGLLCNIINIRFSLLFLSFISVTNVLAEGTAQAMPLSTDGVGLYLSDDGLAGPLLNAPTSRRIRFDIDNNATQNLYFGANFYDRAGTPNQQNNIFIRITNAGGAVVYGPTAIATTGNGLITSYTQAVAGPNIAGTVPTGYTPKVFNPTADGDYYIELYASNNGGTTADLDNFVGVFYDFTIATSAGVLFPGRVSCQKWSFLTYDPSNFEGSNDFSFNGEFYGYTLDSNVLKIDFETGFRPYGYQLAMTKYGIVDNGNFIADRISTVSPSNAPIFPNGYQIFLTEPDSNLYERSDATTPPVFFGNIYGCPGNYFIPYFIEQAGDLAILINLNGVPGYQPSTEDFYFEEFDQQPGNYVIQWDGTNGLGNLVPQGDSLELSASLFRGRANLPMYDAEVNLNGFNVTSVTPNTGLREMYWDDSFLTNFGTCGTQASDNTTGAGVANVELLNPVFGPSHAWDGNADLNVPATSNSNGYSTPGTLCDDFGNARTINTWFYASSATSGVVNKELPPCDNDDDGIPDNVDLDDDNDGVLDVTEHDNIDPIVGDHDNDSIPNYLDPEFPGFVDTNNDGINDNFDFDIDGVMNSFDIDADNDGIPDNIEAQPTLTYIPPSNSLSSNITDLNFNGVDDDYEIGVNIGFNPENTDGTDLPDYLDDDSDNDGILDIEENGEGNVLSGSDDDNDGLDNAFDDIDDLLLAGFTMNDGINPPNASNLGDLDGDLNLGGDVDYRDAFNSAPIAINDDNNTFVDVAVMGGVIGNDFDPNGDSLTVTITPLTGPTNGTIALGTNGFYTYTPDPGFEGEEVFEYEVCDDGIPFYCDTAQVTIIVSPKPVINQNNAPIADNDDNLTFVNNSVTSTVLNNDSDPDNDNLTVTTTPLVNPTNGTIVLGTNGVYTYSPNTDFEGEDEFAYQVCDDGTPVLCDTAIVYITVIDDPDVFNDPPFAGDDFSGTNEDTPVTGDLLANDTDPNGDNLVVTTTPISTPTNGSVIINPNGTYTYTPNPDFNGPDQFVYQVCDDGTPVECAIATVYLLVYPINSAPIAINDDNNTFVDVSVMGGVIGNDFDPDGDNLTITSTPVIAPTNGSLILGTNGVYTYTPDSGFEGQDVFEYEVCDDGTPVICDTAQVTIIVTPPPVINQNNAPIADNDDNLTFVNNSVTSTVLNNDSDPDNDNLTVTPTPLINPTNGTVVLGANGDYTYTPNTDFVGEDEFTYEICDDGSPVLCDTAIVYITVIYNPDPSNDPPFAGDDFSGTNENTSVTGDLLANDTDPNGDNLTVTITPVSTPTNGTVVINSNGTYTYTPNPDFNGPDQFVYQVCDDGTPVECAIATVYLLVYPINDAPIAINDDNNTFEDVAVMGGVIGNDIDPEGDNLVVTSIPVSNPSNGSIILGTDGIYTYTPNSGFVGEEVFEYEVCDDGTPVLCDTAQVTIIVSPIPVVGQNNAPIADNDDNLTFVNNAVTSTVLNNDSDPDNDNLTVTTTPLINPTNGTVVLGANGVYTYTPNTDFVGEDEFTYEVCDDGTPVLCDTAIVYITVINNPDPSNDPPFAGDDFFVTDEDSTVIGDLLPNDSDPNGDNLVVTTTPISTPTNGTVVINPNGTFTYTPNSDFNGPDQFVYQVCDDGSPIECAEATVYILVDPIDDCGTLNVQVFLEGPFSNGSMITVLNDYHLLPGQAPDSSANVGAQFLGVAAPVGQPYNLAPFNHNGMEGHLIGDTALGATEYPSDVVDWILVSIRENGNMPGNEMWKCAGLLKSNGSVEFPTSCPCLETTIGLDYYIVVEHRNHLPVMSTVINPSSLDLSFDFTNNQSWIFGTGSPSEVGQKYIGNRFVMYAGNGNQTSGRTDITSTDNATWILETGGIFNYLKGDFTLNSDANSIDRSMWIPNNGYFTLIQF